MKANRLFDELVHVVGVGVEKSGTTSLSDWLASCPVIASPEHKETFFFNRHYSEGERWYHSLYRPSTDTRFYVDLTPSYFRSSEALERIHGFPGPRKLIFMMRQPVARAYSHYQHDVARIYANGATTDMFQSRGVGSFFEQYGKRRDYYFTKYHDHVRDLLDRFGSANVMFVILEELIADVPRFGQELETFLGAELPKLGETPFPRANRRPLPRLLWSAVDFEYPCGDAGETKTLAGSRLHVDEGDRITTLPPLPDAQTYRALAESSQWTRHVSQEFAAKIFDDFFAEDVEQLEQLIGRDLGVWRSPQSLGDIVHSTGSR